ncbi:MAG TPA: hypothetical protein EYO90_07965 [Candidatus Latescibacteria bacterium]|nr:hypothetical protein [Candidatus Latescibacterota bacterium]
MAVFIRYTDETSLRRRPGDVPRAPAGGRKGWLCGILAALGAALGAGVAACSEEQLPEITGK